MSYAIHRLTAGQQICRLALLLFSVLALIIVIPASDMKFSARACGIALALLFAHIATYGAALRDPSLSFQTALMPRHSRQLLIAAELSMSLSTVLFYVGA